MRAESKIEQDRLGQKGHLRFRRQTMPEQFVNQNEEEVQDQAASSETPQQKIDRVADELAVKPARTEKKFEQENRKIFSK
jgi:hypothetical protein